MDTSFFVPCTRLHLSLYYQDKKKPYLLRFFYSLRLARRWPKRSCPYLLLPAPFAAKLLPSRGPGRLAGKPSAPALPPGSPYYRHQGWGRRSGRGEQYPLTLLPEGLPEPLPLQAAYGRPPHKSRGSSGPTVRPFASGFDGGFCRTQTAHPHHRQPWGWLRGTAPPRTGGTGAECSFPLTTPRAGRVPEGKSGGGLVLSSQLSHKFLPSPDNCGPIALLSARKNLPHTEASLSSPARTGGAASPARAPPSAPPPAAF